LVAGGGRHENPSCIREVDLARRAEFRRQLNLDPAPQS
jgi:hypothetical protein